MSYLQVICEQHRLVEQHLDKFAAPATADGQGGGEVTKEVRSEMLHTDLQVVIS